MAYHAGCAPDICRGSILSSNQHLEAAILTGLYVLCVMMKLRKQKNNQSTIFKLGNNFKIYKTAIITKLKIISYNL